MRKEYLLPINGQKMMQCSKDTFILLKHVVQYGRQAMSHFFTHIVPTCYRKAREFFGLLAILLKVQYCHFIEFTKVLYHYYPRFSFLKIDLTLLLTYLFKNPFSISKRFLLERKSTDLYAYGETPLTTLDYLMKQCNISKKDVVFELGSGRGRTCFWLHTFIGCKVVGIEYIPEFVVHANAIKERFALDDIEFRQEDMLNSDLTGATVIYLYGTCLEEEQIKKLIDKFEKLPAGTKIITVSYPLSDYTQKPLFEVMKCFPAQYPWGTTDIYLHYRQGGFAPLDPPPKGQAPLETNFVS